MTPQPKRVPKGPVIGGYLRRQRGGATQEEIAARVGVDRSQYNGWENGRRGIDPENVEKLATALGVDPREIYELAEEPGAVAELAVQLAGVERRLAFLEEKTGVGRAVRSGPAVRERRREA